MPELAQIKEGEAVASPLDLLRLEQDLRDVIAWCRCAAALQPDATAMPAERCQVCGACTA